MRLTLKRLRSLVREAVMNVDESSFEMDREITREEAQDLMPPDAWEFIDEEDAIFTLDKGGRVWIESEVASDPVTFYDGQLVDEHELRELLGL